MVQLLDATIRRKSSKTPTGLRARTLLGIDARHTPPFADASLIDDYIASLRSPDKVFGFASVWIIGATSKLCARIGDGYP